MKSNIVKINIFFIAVITVGNCCKNLQPEISPQTAKLLGTWRILQWASPSEKDQNLRCATVTFQRKGVGYSFELKGLGDRLRKVTSSMNDRDRTLNVNIDNVSYRNIILETDHHSYIAMAGCPVGNTGKPYLFILAKEDGIKQWKQNQLVEKFLHKGFSERDLIHVKHDKNDCRKIM